MKFSSMIIRGGLVAATVLGGAAWSSQAHAATKGDDSAQDEKGEGKKSGKNNYAEGLFVGRFRRSGMYSSLTLGYTNCSDGRNGNDCDAGVSGLAEKKTKGGFGFTKEIGYRIPWAFFGASYTLGFLRPEVSGLGFKEELKAAYQHSILAVIRPTLPIWRVDLGFTIAPGWSRQVLRPNWDGDKYYSQGFAIGYGVVAAFYITRGWIAGFRWDTIRNRHSKVCGVIDDDKNCTDIESDDPGAWNMGLSGLYLSHRW